MGYFMAGFDIVGIDINPQPYYPFKFIQADVLSIAHRIPWHKASAVHASPPCQVHSVSTHIIAKHGPSKHLDLIPDTRTMLDHSGLPYVIENVPGAPLLDPVLLCGSMFNLHTRNYELKRHRLFELNWTLPVLPAESCGSKRAVTVTGDGGTYRPLGGPLRANGTGIREARPPQGLCRQLMGIPWLPFTSLVQAIPPAYTAFLGYHLREYVA